MVLRFNNGMRRKDRREAALLKNEIVINYNEILISFGNIDPPVF